MDNGNAVRKVPSYEEIKHQDEKKMKNFHLERMNKLSEQKKVYKRKLADIESYEVVGMNL